MALRHEADRAARDHVWENMGKSAFFMVRTLAQSAVFHHTSDADESRSSSRDGAEGWLQKDSRLLYVIWNYALVTGPLGAD
jgi:hypothetical protein